MALLTCSDVTFSYEGIPVLTDVNFTLEAGSYLCIVGENGSGKSTLVKGLLHLKNPSTGSITTGDGLHPSEIGYLPQQTAAQKDFPASVWEVVLSGRQNHPHFPPFYTKADKEDALRNMELLDLLPLKKRCYRDLSGGQQQRVLLARALCATKKLLLLDEPAAGLDPKGRDKILAQIKKYHDEYGKTILLVSHSMEDIVKYAGKVLVMNKSRLFCYDTVDRVFARTDELAKIGLDVPQITRMSHILKSLGTDIGNDIYTTQRAAERLLPLIR